MGFHKIQQGHHYAVKYGIRVWSIMVLTFHSRQYFSPLKVCSSAQMHVGGSLLSCGANAGLRSRLFSLLFLCLFITNKVDKTSFNIFFQQLEKCCAAAQSICAPSVPEGLLFGFQDLTRDPFLGSMNCHPSDFCLAEQPYVSAPESLLTWMFTKGLGRFEFPSRPPVTLALFPLNPGANPQNLCLTNT